MDWLRGGGNEDGAGAGARDGLRRSCGRQRWESRRRGGELSTVQCRPRVSTEGGEEALGRRCSKDQVQREVLESMTRKNRDDSTLSLSSSVLPVCSNRWRIPMYQKQQT